MTPGTRGRTVGRTAAAAVLAALAAAGCSAVASDSVSAAPAPAESVEPAPVPAAPADEDPFQLERDFAPFGPAADALAEVTVAFPDDFAYSDFTETGFVVAFAGVAPEAAIQRLEQPGIPFEVIENVGYSSRQVNAQLDELTEEVRLLTEGKVSFVVAAKPITGRLEVTLYEGGGVISESMLASVGNVKSSLGLPIDVKTAEGTLSTL